MPTRLKTRTRIVYGGDPHCSNCGHDCRNIKYKSIRAACFKGDLNKTVRSFCPHCYEVLSHLLEFVGRYEWTSAYKAHGEFVRVESDG